MRHGEQADRAASQQTVRPQIVQRQREGDRVIVAGLPDPADLAGLVQLDVGRLDDR